MEDIALLITENQNILLFGILINLISTLGFGFYKSLQLNSKQIDYLMQTYKAKDDLTKLLMYWFIPYYGYSMVFKDVILLQRYFNKGFTVFDYVEDKLKQQSAKSKQ